MIANLVYDVGMHNGDDTASYLRKGFRVIGVEANPILAELCRQRFASAIAREALTLLNVGISAQEGVQTFWVNQTHSEFSSFLSSHACREGHLTTPVKVLGVRFASIVAKYGVPYYLKCDIERYDSCCLSALDANDLPRYVSVEAHEVSYLSTLQRLGYNAFKCVDQTAHNLRRDWGPTWLRWGRRKTMRAAQLMKMYTPTFPRGCSGPFGEETPGEWGSLDEVKGEWNRLSSRNGGRLYRLGWFDFHATVLR